MTNLKKPAGAYLIGVAVIVAAFFITNPLLANLLDPTKVWAVLNILMLIGLLTALAFNYAGKRTPGKGAETGRLHEPAQPGNQHCVLSDCRSRDSVSPQLAFIPCPRTRKFGGQPSGVGNLGSR